MNYGGRAGAQQLDALKRMELELGEQELARTQESGTMLLKCVLCFSWCVLVCQRLPSIYRGLRKALEGLEKLP